MRTKLDEIVEEEFTNSLGIVGGLDSPAGRVALRAFRHGVERGEEFLRLTIQNLLKMDSDVLTRGAERVQPAPAEEKNWHSCFCLESGHSPPGREHRCYCSHPQDLSHRVFV